MTIKATAPVAPVSQAILDVHCTTEKTHDTLLGWQVASRNAGYLASLAADKGYDWIDLREKLPEEDVRPLITYRIFRSIDHAHNARVDGPHTANDRCVRPFSRRLSARTATPRVREPGYLEFRELVVNCVVHNIRQAVKP